MLLGTLRASLLGNLLTGKGIVRAGTENNKEKGILRAGPPNKKGKGIVRAGSRKKQNVKSRLMHAVINFEIQKFYENEPRCNGIFSRNDLP